MAANTITEVCGCKADIQAEDGYMSVKVSPGEEDRCRVVLEGFRLHMEALGEMYPKTITIELMEVSS